MIKITTKGSFKNTNRYFARVRESVNVSKLNKYGQQGVQALIKATPKDSGETAASWSYVVNKKGDKYSIEWHNSNISDGYTVAILIQYGHLTKSGGRVEGVDYINPALAPIFERMADEMSMEVSSV